MSGAARDRWARWLLKRCFGGDDEHRDSYLKGLLTWRDRVLGNVFLRSAGNPNIPTLEEATNEAPSREELERFTAHLRPLVENARRRGTLDLACLGAVKQEEKD